MDSGRNLIGSSERREPLGILQEHDIVTIPLGALPSIKWQTTTECGAWNLLQTMQPESHPRNGGSNMDFTTPRERLAEAFHAGPERDEFVAELKTSVEPLRSLYYVKINYVRYLKGLRNFQKSLRA